MTPQELHYLSQAFFFLMLAGFGFSWPFSIIRTYKAGHSGKGVAGKSPMFMIIILVGYVCGIASKLVCPIPEGLTWLQDKWLVLVYLIDMALVSTDLGLYCHYTRKMCSGKVTREESDRLAALLAKG